MTNPRRKKQREVHDVRVVDTTQWRSFTKCAPSTLFKVRIGHIADVVCGVSFFCPKIAWIARVYRFCLLLGDTRANAGCVIFRYFRPFSHLKLQ